MAYVYGTHEGGEARKFALNSRPFGLGMKPDAVDRIEKIVHVASSFTDPGDDWNRFDLYDINGKKIGSITERGY